MQIFYTSTGEYAGVMALDDLVANFNAGNAWAEMDQTEADLRSQLAEEGWFEGTHDCGHFLVLNLDRFAPLGLTARNVTVAEQRLQRGGK